MWRDVRIKNILFILLGTTIYGFGLVNFNIANDLGEGGLTGITLLLLHFTGIDPAYSNLALNIPLFFYWLAYSWKSGPDLHDYWNGWTFFVFMDFSTRTLSIGFASRFIACRLICWWFHRYRAWFRVSIRWYNRR